jgi:hypothetical protein
MRDFPRVSSQKLFQTGRNTPAPAQFRLDETDALVYIYFND